MALWYVTPCALVNRMPVPNNTTSCYIREGHKFCMRLPGNYNSHIQFGRGYAVSMDDILSHTITLRSL